MSSPFLRWSVVLVLGSSFAVAASLTLLPLDREFTRGQDSAVAHEKEVPPRADSPGSARWKRSRPSVTSEPKGSATLTARPRQADGLAANVMTDLHSAHSDAHRENSITHFENTDEHRPNTSTHRENTDTHRPPSNTHFVNTDTHDQFSTTHTGYTDRHFSNTDEHDFVSDEHFVNTDEHFVSTNEHFDNTDQHWTSTDEHFVNTDEHEDDTDEHFVSTDEPSMGTTGHWTNTDTHASSTTSHFNLTDSHPINSSTHTSSTTMYPGDPPPGNPPSCPNPGQPNRGEADVNNATNLTITSYSTSTCGATFRVGHKIVTIDTPRARNLHGKLRLELVSGDATAIYLERASTTTQYALGTNIPVVEPGHYGCGVHDWHKGSEGFTVYPIKPGTVVLRALVDPDPEPEGDGIPTETATITIECPEHSQDKEILYKCFIPCQVADAPWPIPFVAGDDRGFLPAYLASSRTRQKVIARIRANVAPIFSQDEGFDASHEYAAGSVTASTGACPYVLVPGATPSATGTASEPPQQLWTTETMGPAGQKPWERIREIGFRVEAAYPLFAMSCPISSDFYVDLKECGGHFWYRVHGNHDDFPAHEVYLDGTPIHTFNPGSNSFFNLCGGGTDYPVGAWILVP